MSWSPGLPVPTFCFLVVSLPCSFSLSVSLLSQYMCTHVCLFQGRVSSRSTCPPDLYNWSCHQCSHLRTTVRFLSATWGWRNPSVDARCCTNSVIPPTNKQTHTTLTRISGRGWMDEWMDASSLWRLWEIIVEINIWTYLPVTSFPKTALWTCLLPVLTLNLLSIFFILALTSWPHVFVLYRLHFYYLLSFFALPVTWYLSNPSISMFCCNIQSGSSN